jgi:type II secretory pathway predicted ATPase ExeA
MGFQPVLEACTGWKPMLRVNQASIQSPWATTSQVSWLRHSPSNCLNANAFRAEPLWIAPALERLKFSSRRDDCKGGGFSVAIQGRVGAMYLEHFGLRTRPFPTTPNVDAYYPATTYEASLAQIRQALDEDEGIVLLEGEAGSGKTMMAHLLLEKLPVKWRSAFLTHCRFFGRGDLLQAILFDLGLPYQGLSEHEMRLELTRSCLEKFKQGGRTIIVADEAHLLSADQLEELRLLSNLEGKEGKAVQVVLIRLPGLFHAITKPGLEIFRQRLTVSCRLDPLSVEESADYLLHQIRRAGGRPEQLLGEDVLDILSHAARGVPRLLNQAAHCAFKLACEAGNDKVDAEAAVEAISRLGLDVGAEEPPPAASAALYPEAAKPAPLPPLIPIPTPTLPIQIAREGEPPTFIYGGPAANGDEEGNDEDSPGKDILRGFQVPHQRAG